MQIISLTFVLAYLSSAVHVTPSATCLLSHHLLTPTCTIHVVLKSRHISCIMLSHPHAKVHKYLFQLLDSIIVTPNILPLFNDTRNVQPLESSFVWREQLACGWSVLCFLPLSLIIATCNRPSHPGHTSSTIAILQSCAGWLLSTKTAMPGCRFNGVEAHMPFCCKLSWQSVDHLF
jgi:hypothetical protein